MQKHKPIQPGDRFGRLVVISRGERKGVNWHFYWSCTCDCGGTKEVCDNKLKVGDVRSCGCLRRETCSAIGKTNLVHGHAVHGQETPEFYAYRSMLARCYNENSDNYKNYGARGISVCDRWRESFQNFLSDMDLRPSNAHSLERKNNSLGYSPDNCVWATAKEQGRNRRTNKFLTINGETRCWSEWEEVRNLPRRIIAKRVSQGWPLNEKLLSPSARPNARLTKISAQNLN